MGWQFVADSNGCMENLPSFPVHCMIFLRVTACPFLERSIATARRPERSQNCWSCSNLPARTQGDGTSAISLANPSIAPEFPEGDLRELKSVVFAGKYVGIPCARAKDSTKTKALCTERGECTARREKGGGKAT